MSAAMLNAAMLDENMTAIFAAITFGVLLVMTVFIFRYGFVWLRALTSGAYVPLIDIILMQFRRVSASLVVDTYVRLVRAGVAVDSAALQSHVLAGGRIARVADWLVVTKNAGVPLSWEAAATLDLALELPDLEDVSKGEREQIFQRISKEEAG